MPFGTIACPVVTNIPTRGNSATSKADPAGGPKVRFLSFLQLWGLPKNLPQVRSTPIYRQWLFSTSWIEWWRPHVRSCSNKGSCHVKFPRFVFDVKSRIGSRTQITVAHWRSRRLAAGFTFTRLRPVEAQWRWWWWWWLLLLFVIKLHY